MSLLQWLRNELERKHHVMGNVYGSHLPMAIKMEMNILSQVQRLPGLPSSHIGLNTVLGRDETIGFEDYLGGEHPPDQHHRRSHPTLTPDAHTLRRIAPSNP